TAKSLASEGAEVTIVARREDRLIDAQTAIQEITGRKVHYVVGDVTVEEDAKRVVSETIDQFGHIDILINNAGGSSAQSFDAVDNARSEEHTSELQSRFDL